MYAAHRFAEPRSSAASYPNNLAADGFSQIITGANICSRNLADACEFGAHWHTTARALTKNSQTPPCYVKVSEPVGRF